ncbi:MAG TPA: sialidase family protein [Methylocella sp.]|nr:sialidase family protein [Methylocella sp.]
MSSNRSTIAPLLAGCLITIGSVAAGAENLVPGAALPNPATLILSEAVTVEQAGGRHPTVAVDQNTGTAYLAWTQEVPGMVPAAQAKDGRKHDHKCQVLLSRSDDGGRHFGTPVVVSLPRDNVQSSKVTPAQVSVGPKGQVYVLYRSEGPDSLHGIVRLAQSEDGGRSFAEPIEIASEAVEGPVAVAGMTNLFAAHDGSLYASWLDYREIVASGPAHEKLPPKDGEPPAPQLRVARSTDGGGSFAKSTLVTKPVCGCCGTKVTQALDGPLYASTRAAWRELKSSVDAVRDIVVSTSRDYGATWSKAVKIHDDSFKISGCPDVTPGLSVDSKGRLHAAWYTGTERHPGVFYAVSSDQGRTFSEPVPLLTDEWLPYADVKLTLDEKDNVWVAFEDRRGDTDLIRLVRIATDGSLTQAEPWPGTTPDLAAIGNTAVVTWGRLPPEGDEDSGAAIHVVIARPGTGS